MYRFETYAAATIRHAVCFDDGMANALVTFLQDRSGVTAIEYGFVAALLSLVLVATAHSAGFHEGGLMRVLAAALRPSGLRLTP